MSGVSDMAADGERGEQAGEQAAEEDESVLEPLKDEVAKEVGVDPDRYGGNVPAKMWGALGGHMVKRLIEKGKDAMAADDDDSTEGRRPEEEDER